MLESYSVGAISTLPLKDFGRYGSATHQALDPNSLQHVQSQSRVNNLCQQAVSSAHTQVRDYRLILHKLGILRDYSSGGRRHKRVNQCAFIHVTYLVSFIAWLASIGYIWFHPLASEVKKLEREFSKQECWVALTNKGLCSYNPKSLPGYQKRLQDETGE